MCVWVFAQCLSSCWCSVEGWWVWRCGMAVCSWLTCNATFMRQPITPPHHTSLFPSLISLSLHLHTLYAESVLCGCLLAASFE